MGICRASGLGYPSSPFFHVYFAVIGKAGTLIVKGVTLNPLIRGYWGT